MKQYDYFDETLFIITADHIPNTSNPDFLTPLAVFSVPIVFYDPSKLLKAECTIAQHIDIQPSVMHLLGLEGNYVGFGKNLFASNYGDWSFNYLNNMYQLFEGDYLLRFDGRSKVELYHQSDFYKILDSPEDEAVMLRKLQAIIQEVHTRMIDNHLRYE